MTRYLYLLLIVLCLGYSKARSQSNNLKADCISFDRFNTAVRDNRLKKPEALAQFKKLIAAVREHSGQTDDNAGWVFPLQGYKGNAIGGLYGDGYSDKGYNYFDGNKHLAHPAHDIFISDRNQDGIDDKTRQPVNVLAVADGVVIACCNEWEITSALRGGRYIWIYHPKQNIITYYAHNRAIFITPGDVVKRGDKIAEVGRTGYNAFKKRSPTHLHFSAFHLVDDLPVAYNPYQQLIKAEKK